MNGIDFILGTAVGFVTGVIFFRAILEFRMWLIRERLKADIQARARMEAREANSRHPDNVSMTKGPPRTMWRGEQ